MKLTITGLALGAMLMQRPPASTPTDFAGVYQVISNETTLPGGLKNTGSPAEIALLPAAVQQMKGIDLAQDPDKMCQPIGDFRMMAKEGTKIEIVPAAAHGMIVTQNGKPTVRGVERLRAWCEDFSLRA